MDLLLVQAMKVYSDSLGHMTKMAAMPMTKMAAMPIYGKNIYKLSSPEP